MTAPTLAAVTDAVVAHYLETGKPCDANELAQRLGWSVSKVRRVIGDEGRGAAPGTVANQEYRASHSRNYPGFTVGAHKVWVYYPSLWHMRSLILASKGLSP